MRSKSPLRIQVSPVVWREAPRQMFERITRDMAGWFSRKDIDVTLHWVGNDALISRSRSVALSQFLQREKDDVIVMIDADTTWKSGDIERIARRAYGLDGIVGGMVPKRGKGLGIASYPIEEVQLKQGEPRSYEATYVGAAFMACSRSGLQKIVDDLKMERCAATPFGLDFFWPFCLPMTLPSRARPGMTEYMSEDYALCVRAVMADVPVYLDSKPACGHIGEHEYTFQEAMDGASVVGGIDPLGIVGLRDARKRALATEANK